MPNTLNPLKVKRFRYRLTFIMIMLIGIAVLLSGVVMAQTFRANYIDAVENNLYSEIGLIQDGMVWNPSDPNRYETYSDKAKHLKQITKARVTFIAADGTVLGDSDTDASLMDNHANRTEVIEAGLDDFGQEIRYSETINEDYLYVARKVVDANSSQHYYIRLSLSLASVDQTIDRIWRVLTIGLIILFLFAAFVSYRIARSLTRPLESITRVARQIRKFDYSSRVPLQNNDEIGELGVAFNQMADSLQEQMSVISKNETQLESILDNLVNGIVMISIEGRIVSLNRFAEIVLGVSASQLIGQSFRDMKQQYELVQTIEEALWKRKHVRYEATIYYPEQRLMDINVVPVFEDSDGKFTGVLVILQDLSTIRRLERMRSDFVANVSHELKTPVAAVKGFAETLLAGAVNDPATAKQFLQIIYDESERLNRLIGDILDLSAIESRRVPISLSPVELSVLIQSSFDVLANDAQRKSIKLEYDCEPELFVEADEDRLRQMLINLIGNGIAYTTSGGRIVVRASGSPDADDRIVIAVSDNGIGIPAKDLPRIFERFYRVDKARSRGSGGTGLGLAIVKHLVELHHGTIEVASEVGVGTTFTIELPMLQEGNMNV